MNRFNLFVQAVFFLSLYGITKCQQANCTYVDNWINQDNPNASGLIQAFYKYFDSDRSSLVYPFPWSSSLRKRWVDIMTEKWIPIIKSASVEMSRKHIFIYQFSNDFIVRYLGQNKSQVICVPLKGLGYFGDYLNCRGKDITRTGYENYEQSCSKWFPDGSSFRIVTKDSDAPTYCCANRDFLINQNSPDSSILIESFKKAFDNDTTVWTNSRRSAWTRLINDKWVPIMRNTKLINSEKHRMIYDEALGVINAQFGSDLSKVLCVEAGHWGYFGDYLQCHENTKTTPPRFHHECRKWFTHLTEYALDIMPCSSSAYSEYCCSNRESLLNQNNGLESTLIKAFKSSFDVNGKNKSYPFRMSSFSYKLWTTMMTDVWRDLIEEAAPTTLEAKYKKIYETSISYITKKLGSNKSNILCVKLPTFGHFGDFLQCQVDNAVGIVPPPFSLRCQSWFNFEPDWLEPLSPCKEPASFALTRDCCDLSSISYSHGDQLTLTKPNDGCNRRLEFKCTSQIECSQGTCPQFHYTTDGKPQTFINQKADQTFSFYATCTNKQILYQNKPITALTCTREILTNA